MEYSFIAIKPKSTLTQSGSNSLGHIYESDRSVLHLNSVQRNDMLNWIVKNSTVWPFNSV